MRRGLTTSVYGREGLHRRLAGYNSTHAQLLERDREVERLKSMAGNACTGAVEALEIANTHAAKVSSLNQELEGLTMKSELAKFCSGGATVGTEDAVGA
jgi:hypothetical protein